MQHRESLLALVAFFHREIDDTLLLHQEALLLADHALANEAFALVQAQLRAHIEVEDRLLLPLALRVRERFAPGVYAAEHGKILGLLDATAQRLAALDITDRRAVIALLDQERVLKNVVEHHETREEQGLLPGLDAGLAPGEQGALIEAIATEWLAVRHRLAPRLEAVRRRLDCSISGPA